MMNIVLIMSVFSFLFGEVNHNYLDNQIDISVSNFVLEYQDYQKKHYFNGEKSDVIANKINRYLKGVLSDRGKYITEYSLSVGMDPYMAAAVMLHETGCTWKCSYLSRTCNNVAGNKGSPRCNGGSYRKFSTIEEGIKFAIDKLNSYYQKGYKTTEAINPFYATDKTWHDKVNNYIYKLKN